MPLRVFISYDPADEGLLDEFEKHLAALRREGLIETWTRRSIEPGTDRRQAIAAALAASDLVLLLVSADYIASDVERAETETQPPVPERPRIIPIVVRPCLWQGMPFGTLEPLPRGRAVTQYPSSDGRYDEAWVEVVAGLREVIAKWSGERAAAVASPEPAHEMRRAAVVALEESSAPAGPGTTSAGGAAAAGPTASMQFGHGVKVAGHVIQAVSNQIAMPPPRKEGYVVAIVLVLVLVLAGAGVLAWRLGPWFGTSGDASVDAAGAGRVDTGPHVLAGFVRDARLRPVAGASVAVPELGPEAVATTDANGYFRLPVRGPRDKQVVLIAAKPEHGRMEQYVTIGDDNCNVTMEGAK